MKNLLSEEKCYANLVLDLYSKTKRLFLPLLLLASLSSNAALPTQLTSFADIVEKLMPTVVNIYTVKYNSLPSQKIGFLQEILPTDSINEYFQKYNIPFSFEEIYSAQSALALGSGFIVDEQGHIITNNHVVAGSDEIYVKLSDNTEVPAKIVGTDPKTDIALLKIEMKDKLPYVTFGDSTKSRIGDIVIAIGNPLGFGGTVTTGIISSKGRDLGANQDDLVDNFIQTDAAINTGNSGGPLFDIEGRVIGVNASVPDVNGGTNIGIGFAIPSNTVQDIMGQLKEKGKISRGKLDITVQQVTKELAEAMSLGKSSGVLVASVKPGGVGARAGLHRGDVITEFNDKEVSNSRKLHLLVAESHIGDKVKIALIRDNKPITLYAQIADVEMSKEQLADQQEVTTEKSGLVFSAITPVVVTKFNLDPNSKGVVVVDIISQDVGYDLRVGDLILAVNQEYVNDIEQFDFVYEKTKSNNKRNLVLLVKRGELTMFVALPVDKLDGK